MLIYTQHWCVNVSCKWSWYIYRTLKCKCTMYVILITKHGSVHVSCMWSWYTQHRSVSVPCMWSWYTQHWSVSVPWHVCDPDTHNIEVYVYDVSDPDIHSIKNRNHCQQPEQNQNIHRQIKTVPKYYLITICNKRAALVFSGWSTVASPRIRRYT